MSVLYVRNVDHYRGDILMTIPVDGSGNFKLENTNRVALYFTYNGVPLYTFTNKPRDEGDTIVPGFLSALDMFAKELSNEKPVFQGFILGDREVEIMEVADKGRVFIDTPYCNVLENNVLKRSLFGVTKKIVSKILREELLSCDVNKATKYFEQGLKEYGYKDKNRLVSELIGTKRFRSELSEYLHMSLLLIEENESGTGYQVKEMGNYNTNLFKKNPAKNENGEFNFKPEFLPGLAGALISYQSSLNLANGSLLLKFRDYLLDVSYKEDGSPIVGILVKKNGKMSDPLEFLRYTEDLKKLKNN